MGVKHFCAVLLLFGAVSLLWSQSATEEELHQLLNQADHATRPQPWARLLIEADAEAVKLGRREPSSNGEIRSIKAEGFGFFQVIVQAVRRQQRMFVAAVCRGEEQANASVPDPRNCRRAGSPAIRVRVRRHRSRNLIISPFRLSTMA